LAGPAAAAVSDFWNVITESGRLPRASRKAAEALLFAAGVFHNLDTGVGKDVFSTVTYSWSRLGFCWHDFVERGALTAL
jgi:hypothetical protein